MKTIATDAAFARPASDLERQNGEEKGLSKREYFAAAALQGLLANQHFEGNPNDVAEWALERADALIEKLNE